MIQNAFHLHNCNFTVISPIHFCSTQTNKGIQEVTLVLTFPNSSLRKFLMLSLCSHLLLLPDPTYNFPNFLQLSIITLTSSFKKRRHILTFDILIHFLNNPRNAEIFYQDQLQLSLNCQAKMVLANP